MEFFKHFFSTTADPRMDLFTAPHLIPIGLIIISIILLGIKKEFFKSWKYERHFRYFLAISLFINDLSVTIWRFATNTYDIRHTLPLHLCSISIYLIIILLITKNKKIFDHIFYFFMAGALMALLTPDLRFSFTQYRYYEFMIVHGLIMFSIMYMLFVYDFVPGFDSLKKSFFTVHLIGLVMIPFNYTFNASYMLLVNKPSGTILDLFGEWPVYLIGIELLLIILFSINYSLIYFFILRPKTSLLNDVFLIIKDNGNSIV